MRGDERFQEEMFSYGSLSQRIPQDHPLRRIRFLADEAMSGLAGSFEQMYSRLGCLVPEFVGLGLNERVWDASSFTKNREGLLSGEVAQIFFTAVVAGARCKRLLSDEHFTVDGTLIEAWASEKSYQKKPGPPPAKGTGSGADGAVLLADTHESKTDPDARMYRKGFKTGWKLQHMAHAISENEHGLVVATAVTHCSPRAEAHVPRYASRRQRCQVDPALYEKPEYVRSQKKRKWIERFFSWLKNTAQLRKTRHRGHPKLNWNFTLAAAAYNIVRIANLSTQN
jgi:hypothetical protein